jgi:hypothetical protein
LRAAPFARVDARLGGVIETSYQMTNDRCGNGWTPEQLKKRFDAGPVDWAEFAADAQKAGAKQ